MTEREYLMESIAPWDPYFDDSEVTQEYIDGAWGGLEELARRCSELLTHKRRRETMPDNRRFDYLTGLWKTYSALQRSRPDRACHYLYETIHFNSTQSGQVEHRILVNIMDVIGEAFQKQLNLWTQPPVMQLANAQAYEPHVIMKELNEAKSALSYYQMLAEQKDALLALLWQIMQKEL